MADHCSNPNCTVAETGTCVLGLDPNDCEHNSRSVEVDNTEQIDGTSDVADPSEAVLDPPEASVAVDNGLALGLDELRTLMSGNKTLLIGIIGSPAAGKTAALVSIYLLLAHGKLEGFQFADSQTLISFDEIGRGARQWAETQPDELTSRTELSDIRHAGFLHLKLLREADQQIADIAFSDLPGEWSDDLAEVNRTDRLDFLHAAGAIWLVIDGKELRDIETKMRTLRRTKLLLQRLQSMLPNTSSMVKLVVSYADHGPISDDLREKLVGCSPDPNAPVEVLEIASFSDTQVPPGTGLSELIAASFPSPPTRPTFWGEAPPDGERYSLKYTARSIEGG